MYPNATLESEGGLEVRRGRQLLDLEVAHERLADGLLLLAVLLQAREQAVGGEDGEAGVGERAEEHQDVAVFALAAHLLGVHPRRLVAMVAVGDQQLGPGEPVDEASDRGGVGDPPERVAGALVVGCGGEGLTDAQLVQRRPHGAIGVREQAEDGGEIRARRARETEAILLRPRVGALVRPDASRAVVLHAHAREEARPREVAAVGARVVLAQGPDRGLILAHQHPALPPRCHGRGRVLVGVASSLRARQIDLHDVVLAARHELVAELVVDHVVGRRDHVL